MSRNDYVTTNPNLPWWSESRKMRADEHGLMLLGTVLFAFIGAIISGMLAVGLDLAVVWGPGSIDDSSATAAPGAFYAWMIGTGAVLGALSLFMNTVIGPMIYPPIEHESYEHKVIYEAYQRSPIEQRRELDDIYKLIMETPSWNEQFQEMTDLFYEQSRLYERREQMLQVQITSPQLEAARDRVDRLKSEIEHLSTGEIA